MRKAIWRRFPARGCCWGSSSSSRRTSSPVSCRHLAGHRRTGRHRGDPETFPPTFSSTTSRRPKRQGGGMSAVLRRDGCAQAGPRPLHAPCGHVHDRLRGEVARRQRDSGVGDAGDRGHPSRWRTSRTPSTSWKGMRRMWPGLACSPRWHWRRSCPLRRCCCSSVPLRIWWRGSSRG